VLFGWPNKSRWLDEPMPSELLKAAVWGSIWMLQGGLGTLGQIHSPLVFLPGVFPRLATNCTGARRARRSSVVRDSDEADHDFVTIQKIRRESTEAGSAAVGIRQSGWLIPRRRLPRGLFGATVMSNSATPGF
jgi:hypothetical protein